MKKLILIIILSYFAYHAKAQEAIVCQDGHCSIPSSINASHVVETSSFSQFRITGLEDSLDVYAEDDTNPRNSKMTIFESEGEAINLNIHLPSTKAGVPGGSTVVIGDNLSSLSVNTSGANGAGADDASIVCARKIMAGDLGPNARSSFIISRNSDPSLPTDRCTTEDMVALQNSTFNCDPSFAEFDGISVNASRINKRRQCTAESSRMMCVDRKVKISCTWVADKFPDKASCSPEHPEGTAVLSPKPRGGGYGGRDWECDPDLASTTASGWKLRFDPFILSESYLNSRRQTGISDEVICDELTGRNTTYLNSISSMTKNYYTRRGYGGHQVTGYSNMVPATNSMEVKGGHWIDHSSDPVRSNPGRVIDLSSFGWGFNIEVYPCNSNAVRSIGAYLGSFYNGGCRGFSNGQVVGGGPATPVSRAVKKKGGGGQYWISYTVYMATANAGWRSHAQPLPSIQDYSRHTIAYTQTIRCWPIENNSKIDCSNTSLGEAHGHSFKVRMNLYAPNGRFIQYITHRAYGVY